MLSLQHEYEEKRERTKTTELLPAVGVMLACNMNINKRKKQNH
jgi:hypothetical protein